MPLILWHSTHTALAMEEFGGWTDVKWFDVLKVAIGLKSAGGSTPLVLR